MKSIHWLFVTILLLFSILFASASPSLWDWLIVMKIFGIQTEVIYHQGRITEIYYPSQRAKHPVSKLREYTRHLNQVDEFLSYLEPDSLAAVKRSTITMDYYEYHCSISTIASDIKYLTALKILRINDCSSVIMPDELGELRALEHLEIAGYNRLINVNLPDTAGQLTNLQRLTVFCSTGDRAETRIKLPSDIGNLKSLKRLHILNCGLSSVPTGLTKLNSLEELDLRNNRTSNLSGKVDELVSLQKLYLGANNFEQVPLGIGHLKKLNTLDLSMNHISTLPPSIGQLEALEVLLGCSSCSGLRN